MRGELGVFRRARYRQLPSFLRYYYKVFFGKNQAIFHKIIQNSKKYFLGRFSALDVCNFSGPLDTSSPLENCAEIHYNIYIR